MGYILTGDALKRYAETRLFGTNVKSEVVDKVELHNGTLPSQLLQIYAELGEQLTLVEQVNAREPLYHHDGVLHIPQYSGFGRARRYRRLIKRYSKETNNHTKFTEEALMSKVDINMAYDNYAYDHIKKIYEQEPILRLDSVVLGNTEAITKQATVLTDFSDEYLDTQLVRVNDKHVLSFGYVYGDQAGILLNKFLRHWDAHRNGKEKLGIYNFGRFGSLEYKTQRNDLLTPTRLMNESDILRGRVLEHPIDNCFASEQTDCLNINVRSVVDETHEGLREAKYYGAHSVDMELFEIIMAINQARERYEDDGEELTIEFGSLGYVSDKPLQGDTLADELDSDEGERAAVARILEHITSS